MVEANPDEKRQMPENSSNYSSEQMLELSEY